MNLHNKIKCMHITIFVKTKKRHRTPLLWIKYYFSGNGNQYKSKDRLSLTQNERSSIQSSTDDRIAFVFIDSSMDWLLLFYILRMNFSLWYNFSSRKENNIWRRHHYRWRAPKFRPMLGVQGLWTGRDLYRATPPVTQGLSFFLVSSQISSNLVTSYESERDAKDIRVLLLIVQTTWAYF
jgi:hypothetical protein